VAVLNAPIGGCCGGNGSGSSSSSSRKSTYKSEPCNFYKIVLSSHSADSQWLGDSSASRRTDGQTGETRMEEVEANFSHCGQAAQRGNEIPVDIFALLVTHRPPLSPAFCSLRRLLPAVPILPTTVGVRAPTHSWQAGRQAGRQHYSPVCCCRCCSTAVAARALASETK